MTVALGLAGFFMIPNWPDKPNPWAFWMKPHHYEIARARTARFKRASNKKFTWSTVKRSVKLPLFYLIPCLYVATVLAQAGYQCEPQDAGCSSFETLLTDALCCRLQPLAESAQAR
jgi:hypothetical protein